MGRFLDKPGTLIILLIVVVVVFGASKLPVAAKSLGQSLRIFKKEIRTDDPKADDPQDDMTTDRADQASSGNDRA